MVKDPVISCGCHLPWGRGRWGQHPGACLHQWAIHLYAKGHTSKTYPRRTQVMHRVIVPNSQWWFPPAPFNNMAAFLYKAFSTSEPRVCSNKSQTWLVSTWEQECGALFLIHGLLEVSLHLVLHRVWETWKSVYVCVFTKLHALIRGQADHCRRIAERSMNSHSVSLWWRRVGEGGGEAGRKGQFRQNSISEMRDKMSASVKLSP